MIFLGALPVLQLFYNIYPYQRSEAPPFVVHIVVHTRDLLSVIFFALILGALSANKKTNQHADT